MNDILTIILLTLLPISELRGSIPYGIFNTGLSPAVVFAVAVAANILLAKGIFIFVRKAMPFFVQFAHINTVYTKFVLRTQQKIHPYIEKYGVLGLAIFIGIPLPGSGVYTGALGAYLLGFTYKEFFKAAVIGVLMAGILVLLASTLGEGVWNIFIKQV